MLHIAIIGSGQLGSRHLQAIAQIDLPAEIQVVDPDRQALAVAKERFEQMSSNPNLIKISFLNSLESLNREIDFCIISTNSDVRARVAENVLSRNDVRYLLLEKFLFQTEREFEYVGDLIEKNQVKAWVNCPRRMWPVYREIRDHLKGGRLLEFDFSGSSWGLASNSIHLIDLIAFLGGIVEYDIGGDMIDPGVIESKRKGFIEFTGSLKGAFKDGANFSISSYKYGNVPSIITVIGEHSIHIMSEHNGRGWISSEGRHWEWCEFVFETPYQSQLTHKFIRQIEDEGSCDLPSFEESSRLHIPILNCFTSLLGYRDADYVGCPIT